MRQEGREKERAGGKRGQEKEGNKEQGTGAHPSTEGVGGAWEVTEESWPKVPPLVGWPKVPPLVGWPKVPTEERWPKVPPLVVWPKVAPTSGREERGKGKLEVRGELGSLEKVDFRYKEYAIYCEK